MSNDADGILRLYSYNLIQNGNWSVLWSSNIDKVHVALMDFV